jgi:para-nitrobenzyl esterase
VSVSAVVETGAGRLQGASTRGLHVFRGVPYAAAPSGALRFRPPQPPTPWAGVRDATRSGPAAPQLALPIFSWINAAARTPGDDCLTLNVFTPGLDCARRPVLFWIHGGGFMVGSGSTVLYEGQALAERGDVVVVTINYRLGALGFGHLGAVLGGELADCTNLGIRDQIAALEWVRENIDRFGGDPDNVTVFGQSAGGMSVATLLGAPRARKLFRRAICQSGAADHVIEREEAERVAAELVSRLGGPPASHAVLGRIPIGSLLEAQRGTTARLANWNSLMVFLPMVDGDVVPEQPIAAIRRGDTAHIPIMTGATLEEWKLFGLLDPGIGRFDETDLCTRLAEVLPADAPAPAEAARNFQRALGERSAARSPREVWSAFQTSRVFHVPSARLAEAQHEGGGCAHSYLVTWRAPALRRALGACHAIEIPFVFGNESHPLARPFSGLGGGGARFARRLQRSWLGFARSGDPSHDRLPTWPRYRPSERATMILGRECSLADAPLDAERELLVRWKTERGAARGGVARPLAPARAYLQPSTS